MIYSESKKIVEQIKNEEEKRYGLSFDIEMPTMIRFYIDNIKNKNITLDNSGISKALMGVTSAGFATPFSENNYICVFNKNYKLDYMFSEPMLYLKNLEVSFQEFEVSRILYHEIRHILQAKRQDLFSSLENFCVFSLSYTNNLKYYYDEKFHDSMYNEIDANLYSYERLYQKYSDNPEVANYIIKELNKVRYLKYTYDFDYHFEKHALFLKENGLKKVPYNNVLYEIFWNEDGTFKSFSEVFSYLKNYSSIDATVKVLTSDIFLNSIDFQELTDEEKEWLKMQFSINEYLINERENAINYYVKEEGMIIDQEEFDKSIKEERKRKNRYRKLLNVKRIDSEEKKR